MARIQDRLESTLARLLERRRARGLLRSLTNVPTGMADLSSNAYLSLAANARVQAAFLSRMQAMAGGGSSLLGSGGSRLLDGNSPYAESVEETIATFHNAPAGLLFNSAMDANVGLFSCVPQPGDVIVYDELIHASVHDGMRLGRAAKRIPFAHNRIWTDGRTNRSEDAGSYGGDVLETVLKAVKAGQEGHAFASGGRNVFIAVEGVYSMDGDIVPLADVVECVEKILPQRNGYIIVDEAHSIGIFGENGQGLVCHLGLEDRVWARVLGFGKAMGCSGGIVLCSRTTRSYLINYARSLIYTTAMAVPSLVAIEVVYNFVMSGQAGPLMCHLRDLTRQTHKGLLAISSRWSPPPAVFRVTTFEPKSPIIPVFTTQPRSLADHCQRRGFMVRPIVAPTIPEGSERIRVCLHAGNTVDDIKGLITAMEAWVVARLMKIDPAEERTSAGGESTTGKAGSRSVRGLSEKAKL